LYFVASFNSFSCIVTGFSERCQCYAVTAYLSHTSIVAKRIQLKSCSLHCQIAMLS